MTEFSFPLKDVKAVNAAEARRLFELANHFWFEEGCDRQVLPIYFEALKYDPTDPVMLYQLAVVLRAFERFNEAVQALEKASQHQERRERDWQRAFCYNERVATATSLLYAASAHSRLGN